MRSADKFLDAVDTVNRSLPQYRWTFVLQVRSSGLDQAHDTSKYCELCPHLYTGGLSTAFGMAITLFASTGVAVNDGDNHLPLEMLG